MARPIGAARRAWLEAGLSILAEAGERGLTIERLCERTGRTKGSYYHHFRDPRDYTEALVDHWATSFTGQVILQADRAPDARRRWRALAREVAGIDGGVEWAMRRWAASNDEVRRRVQAVDERRIKYLAELNRLTGHVTNAGELARIEYAAWLGMGMLSPEAGPGERERVAARIHGLLHGSGLRRGRREG